MNEAEKEMKTAKIVITHSNFYINKEVPSIGGLDNVLLDKLTKEITMEDVEEGQKELVEYIKRKLDIKVPDDIIKSILDLENNFYINLDNINDQSI
jgi:hypothetical protein